MPPLRASRPLACLPKGSLSQRPKCPPLFHLTPKSSCPPRAEEGGTKGKGVPCTYLSPLPQMPQTFCTFLQGCPSQQSPSWLIKSSDWCCVPSLWPLCRGGCPRGRAWRGQAGTQGLTLGMWGPAGGRPTGKGT